MKLQTRILHRMIPLLSHVLSPRRAIDLSKQLYLKQLMDAHDIRLIFDIGGNIGQFAREMRRIGYRGRIVSFEPQPDAFERLSEAARGDARWQVYNYALGVSAGRQPFNIMASNSMSSFHAPSTDQTAEYNELNVVVETREVEVRRLDEVAAELRLDQDLDRCFLKCDTQGFELEVLKGAGELLTEIRMVILELSSVALYRNAPTLADVLAFLEPRGFAPVSFFPVSRLSDGSAPEFDYLGINRMLASRADPARERPVKR